MSIKFLSYKEYDDYKKPFPTSKLILRSWNLPYGGLLKNQSKICKICPNGLKRLTDPGCCRIDSIKGFFSKKTITCDHRNNRGFFDGIDGECEVIDSN